LEADSVKLIGIKNCLREFNDFFGLFRVLAIDYIITRLQISLVAARQGLKVLRLPGAVKCIYIPGALRDKYLVKLELTKTLTGFFQEELRPWLDQALERICAIQSITNAIASGGRSLL
jgi:DNA-binding transcriptional regulator GbsR (MarR family)